MDTSKVTKCLESSQPWMSETLFDRLHSKDFQEVDFLFVLYSKPQREFRKPKFKIGDIVRISKYDLPFRKGYKQQFTRGVFEIVAISPGKPRQHTQWRMNRMTFHVANFIRKCWSQSFNNGFVYPNVCLGNVECWLYTRRIALKDDYHKKWMDMLAYTPVAFNYLESSKHFYHSR